MFKRSFWWTTAHHAGYECVNRGIIVTEPSSWTTLWLLFEVCPFDWDKSQKNLSAPNSVTLRVKVLFSQSDAKTKGQSANWLRKDTQTDHWEGKGRCSVSWITSLLKWISRDNNMVDYIGNMLRYIITNR